MAVGAEEGFVIGDGDTFTGDAVVGITDGVIVGVAVGITDSVSSGVITSPSPSLSSLGDTVGDSVGDTVRDGEPVDDGVCVRFVTIVNVPSVAGAVSKPTFSPLKSDNCRLFKHISVVSPGSPTTLNLSNAMMPLVPFCIASTSLPVYAIETLVPQSKSQYAGLFQLVVIVPFLTSTTFIMLLSYETSKIIHVTGPFCVFDMVTGTDTVVFLYPLACSTPMLSAVGCANANGTNIPNIAATNRVKQTVNRVFSFSIFLSSYPWLVIHKTFSLKKKDLPK